MEQGFTFVNFYILDNPPSMEGTVFEKTGKPDSV